MGDTGDDYKAWKDHKRANSIQCPGCIKDHPKRHPTNLMPGQRCKVCGHKRQSEA